MRKKAIISGVLTGALSLSMVVPAMAAGIGDSVIDETRYGTLNIHKLIENDGENAQANGLADPDENRVPVNNIGFDYVKVANIQNVAGIVISKDGAINWAESDGRVAVGAYYVPTAKFQELLDIAGIEPSATYIKTAVEDDTNPAQDVLEYDYNDEKAAGLLNQEQAAVDAAKEDLDEARADYRAAKKAASQEATTAANAAASQAAAQNALNAANTALTAAQSAEAAAQDEVDAAQTAFDEANTAAGTASASLATAQSAFDTAKSSYTGDQAALNNAQAAMTEASNQQKAAAKAASEASKSVADATADHDNAKAALDAATEILQAALAGQAAAAPGTADSAAGTANAVAQAQKQFEAASEWEASAAQKLADAEDAADEARDALSDAEDALDEAIAALQTAQNSAGTSSTAFTNAIAALKQAKADNAAAQSTLSAAQSRLDKANSAHTAAENAVTAASEARDRAQTAYNAAAQAAEAAASQSGTATADLAAAQTAYNEAKAAYDAAVAALDSKATENGIIKVYTAEDIQDAMSLILATVAEEDINDWVAANAPSDNGALAEGYTDDHGTANFSDMDLGLYIVAETDITYHDGIAGAWNDKAEGGVINNDQKNTYDTAGGTYTITPIDAHDQGVTHTYQAGEYYHESINPEYPVVENKVAPFFVSLPTTNTEDTTAGDVAAGDNYGEAGTVWQYTVDVYPKNQTTAIYKRIVDPDEADGAETLRTSEDYQMGDIIEQIIWADAPVLQPNYLNSELPANEHEDFVIFDSMTDGLSFMDVSKVVVLPASQLKGANLNENIVYYTDGEGTRVSEEDALDEQGNLKTYTKYYDGDGREITKEVYDAISDNNGSEKSTREFSYKKITAPASTTALPNNIATFEPSISESSEGAITLERDVDYIVVSTDETAVLTNDGEETLVPAGTHGFAVKLTPAGLAKLNAREDDSTVVVYFDSVLNSDAKIGQVQQNMNYPTLFFKNSSHRMYRKVSGNEVYDYTYELNIRKDGVEDASNVKFIIARSDDNDLNQAAEKDMSGMTSATDRIASDDNLLFVPEAPGVYHVMTRDESVSDVEKSTVNGVDYYTVTPAPNGTLILKGLDSDVFTFKEIQTEAGKSLLADDFTVTIKAADDAVDSLRDGRITEATVQTGNGNPIDITIGIEGTSEQDSVGSGVKNLGIAGFAVTNNSVVDLRTGGTGRMMIYIAGIALVGALSVGMFVVGRKKDVEAE